MVLRLKLGFLRDLCLLIRVGMHCSALGSCMWRALLHRITENVWNSKHKVRNVQGHRCRGIAGQAESSVALRTRRSGRAGELLRLVFQNFPPSSNPGCAERRRCLPGRLVLVGNRRCATRGMGRIGKMKCFFTARAFGMDGSPISPQGKQNTEMGSGGDQ